MTATHERDQHEAFGATHNRQAHWHIESDILSAGHCPFIPTRYLYIRYPILANIYNLARHTATNSLMGSSSC